MLITAIGILISAIGAISGGQYLMRLARRRFVQRRYRNMLPRHRLPVRYTALEIGAVVGDGGLSWHVIRTATLVAEADGVDHIAINGTYYDLEPESFSHAVAPTELQLVEIPAVHPRSWSVQIKLPKALKDGESLTYQYTRSFRKLPSRAPEDLFMGTTATPCDKLILRIVFRGWRPSDLRHKVLSGTGAEKAHDEPITPDPLSGEVRIEVPHPDPMLKYGFTWRYPANV